MPAQLQDIIVMSDMLCQNHTVALQSLAHFRFGLNIYILDFIESGFHFLYTNHENTTM